MANNRPMRAREDAIAFGLQFPGAYEDYPFHDANWTAIRCGGNHRIFLLIYERLGNIWLNVKCDPEWRYVLQSAYASIVPAFHMNKQHWTSVILDGTVPEEIVRQLIEESYKLVKK